MQYRSIFAILFYFFLSVALSEEKLLSCGKNNYKIKLPLIGFDKAFLKVKDKWQRLKKLEITEDFFLINDVPTMQEKCAENKCITNIRIAKELTGNSHMEYTIKAATDDCKIDGFNINKFLIQEEGYECFKRKKGESLEKGYCEILNIE